MAKSLAKMLSPLIGMIDNSHIKKFSDLLNKINNSNIKKIVSSQSRHKNNKQINDV